MKSRINEDWFKTRTKKLCAECQDRMIKKHVQEYERAIREGFRAGLAVAMKSQQLYRGYGKKRLQRLAEDVNDLVNLKPFGREINFKYIVDEMKEKFQANRGFVKACWCGDPECEGEVKYVTGGAATRCLIEDEEMISDKCIWCGKPAKHMAYWGKSY